MSSPLLIQAYPKSSLGIGIRLGQIIPNLYYDTIKLNAYPDYGENEENKSTYLKHYQSLYRSKSRVSTRLIQLGITTLMVTHFGWRFLHALRYSEKLTPERKKADIASFLLVLFTILVEKFAIQPKIGQLARQATLDKSMQWPIDVLQRHQTQIKRLHLLTILLLIGLLLQQKRSFLFQ